MVDKDLDSDYIPEPANPTVALIKREISAKSKELVQSKDKLATKERERDLLTKDINYLKDVEIAKGKEIIYDLRQSVVLLLENSIIINEEYTKLLECILFDDQEFVEFIESKLNLLPDEEQSILMLDNPEAIIQMKARFLSMRGRHGLDTDKLYEKNHNNSELLSVVGARLESLGYLNS